MAARGKIFAAIFPKPIEKLKLLCYNIYVRVDNHPKQLLRPTYVCQF